MEPPGRRRREVKVHPLVLGQPGLDVGMGVGRGVDDHDVHVEASGDVAFHHGEEGEELVVAVPALAQGEHLPVAVFRAA